MRAVTLERPDVDSTGYPASDEPIRARVECYSPRWQILMKDILPSREAAR